MDRINNTQSLETPKDSLLKFNEKIANKHKSGLLLQNLVPEDRKSDFSNIIKNSLVREEKNQILFRIFSHFCWVYYHYFVFILSLIYDKNIPISVTTNQNLDEFTSSKLLEIPFKRTISRLYELTSINKNQ